MTKKELKDKVEQVLSRTDIVGMHAIGRALVHLKNRQTQDEQVSLTTKHHNNRGFMPQHATIGVNMAHFYEENGFLTERQLKYWRDSTPKINKSRISRYTKQLIEESEKKLQSK